MRVIILDYDDTLFPSSHVAQYNLYQTKINSSSFLHHREAFHEMETAAISLLGKAIAVGDLVVIVTNGKLDWIKYSVKMFYPRFFDFLRENETPIVSAQDIFAQSNPHPVMWKVNCFRQLLGSLQKSNNMPTMLMSIGDGSHEAIACEVAAREFGIRHRNVNLLATPSPKQMTQQLHLLARQLSSVIDEQSLHSDFTASELSGGQVSFQAATVNHYYDFSNSHPTVAVGGEGVVL